jgi:Asparagine synthase
MAAPSYTSFSLHGYSPWPVERIISAVDGGTRIADLPGDFTAIASGMLDARPYVRIVTSMVAARPYYFARTNHGLFIHGSSVFDVVRDARLVWKWNPRAITALALFGHTVGDDTLHPDVAHMPCAAVLTATEGHTRIERHDDAWTAVFAQRPADDPNEAVSTLEEVFREMAAPDAVVSLSAGFDSRLLLALALRAGHRPRALTMGFDDSTDVRVARQITAALGLEHRVVEIAADDYFAHARAIVACTSGAKTAAHWHTDLYVRAAGLGQNVVHYIGSNGEFARTFYLDWGLAGLVGGAGPNALFEAYFATKLARRARRFPRALFAPGPDLREFVRGVARSVTVHTHTFAEALDCFYSTERVRHFIGNGLALYARHSAPRSPFLDARWIRAIARLPRAERLGSNYHRRAIAGLWPQLLAFPVGAGGPMERRAPPLYHLRNPKPTGYSPFAEVLSDPRTRELVVESNGLDEILPRVDRIAAATSHGPAAELLLTLAIAADLGREAART